MEQATLFFQNLTAIDHAVLDPVSGKVSGGSYNLSVWISGEIEENEQVVVDFSQLKNNIKKIIDHKLDGYDHKLWIPLELVSPKNYLGDMVYVETENFSCLVPRYTVKLIHNEISMDLMCQNISIYLESKLDNIYPDSGLTVSVFLSENKNTPFTQNYSDDKSFKFRYVHGLKNSSSEPCQNINHGHCSYMGLVDFDGQAIDIPKQITNDYSDVVFVWKENIVTENKNWLTVGYKANSGTFLSRYNKNVHNLVITPCETTVENLARWFTTEYKHVLSDLERVDRFFLTEGLNKGSLVTL